MPGVLENPARSLLRRGGAIFSSPPLMGASRVHAAHLSKTTQRALAALNPEANTSTVPASHHKKKQQTKTQAKEGNPQKTTKTSQNPPQKKIKNKKKAPFPNAEPGDHFQRAAAPPGSSCAMWRLAALPLALALDTVAPLRVARGARGGLGGGALFEAAPPLPTQDYEKKEGKRWGCVLF